MPNVHDSCYGRPNANKKDCDKVFLECAKKNSSGWWQKVKADVMYAAVDKHGRKAFCEAQEQFVGCKSKAEKK